ncbi:MAG TPA: formate dehydrogenase accessory protein FdhE [Humidesulfovibrio sp.]|uniref:formate dehydrogenase accessory protein FdhE n=1 Tax=Humidesulfovibrio sp. TaxID=2910988 RepID=UPI002C479804|nr:formate dehydrogenase accessory protein FdhE [Humidesulfovibrio sp.]HWR03732.1 formate dehydrogenase accessory protein FdhE [Humidesulfovibrio sp.]
MTSPETSPRLRAIQTALSRAQAELPALQPLLDAFGPLLATQARIFETAPGWQGSPPTVDAERFCQGVFLLADLGFEDMSAQLPVAAKELLPLMAASFPALAQEFAALEKALDSGALAPADLAAAAFGEELALPGVSAQTAAFAATEITRPFLRRQAEDLLKLVKDLPWQQNFCPVCGAAPNMSELRRVDEDNEFIKAHGGRRFLRCSCCASEWTHKRVACPMCGCVEPDDLVVLRDPERPFERADACKHCKAFVLCLDSGELVDVPSPDVAALTMLPLEYQAREQGFVPLALQPWSDL